MRKPPGNLRLSALTIAASLLLLAGCATPLPPPPVQCPPLPTAPSILLTPPPSADFQQRLRSFFLTSPTTQTERQSTPAPATSGSKN